MRYRCMQVFGVMYNNNIILGRLESHNTTTNNAFFIRTYC